VAPHSPMKILHSKKKVEGFEHKVFSLTDVYWKLDEAAVLDHKFRKALSRVSRSTGNAVAPYSLDSECLPCLP
jgi:hypothetical protein